MSFTDKENIDVELHQDKDLAQSPQPLSISLPSSMSQDLPKLNNRCTTHSQTRISDEKTQDTCPTTQENHKKLKRCRVHLTRISLDISAFNNVISYYNRTLKEKRPYLEEEPVYQSDFSSEVSSSDESGDPTFTPGQIVRSNWEGRQGKKRQENTSEKINESNHLNPEKTLKRPMPQEISPASETQFSCVKTKTIRPYSGSTSQTMPIQSHTINKNFITNHNLPIKNQNNQEQQRTLQPIIELSNLKQSSGPRVKYITKRSSDVMFTNHVQARPLSFHSVPNGMLQRPIQSPRPISTPRATQSQKPLLSPRPTLTPRPIQSPRFFQTLKQTPTQSPVQPNLNYQSPQMALSHHQQQTISKNQFKGQSKGTNVQNNAMRPTQASNLTRALPRVLQPKPNILQQKNNTLQSRPNAFGNINPRQIAIGPSLSVLPCGNQNLSVIPLGPSPSPALPNLNRASNQLGMVQAPVMTITPSIQQQNNFIQPPLLTAMPINPTSNIIQTGSNEPVVGTVNIEGKNYLIQMPKSQQQQNVNTISQVPSAVNPIGSQFAQFSSNPTVSTNGYRQVMTQQQPTYMSNGGAQLVPNYVNGPGSGQILFNSASGGGQLMIHNQPMGNVFSNQSSHGNLVIQTSQGAVTTPGWIVNAEKRTNSFMSNSSDPIITFSNIQPRVTQQQNTNSQFNKIPVIPKSITFSSVGSPSLPVKVVNPLPQTNGNISQNHRKILPRVTPPKPKLPTKIEIGGEDGILANLLKGNLERRQPHDESILESLLTLGDVNVAALKKLSMCGTQLMLTRNNSNEVITANKEYSSLNNAKTKPKIKERSSHKTKDKRPEKIVIKTEPIDEDEVVEIYSSIK